MFLKDSSLSTILSDLFLKILLFQKSFHVHRSFVSFVCLSYYSQLYFKKNVISVTKRDPMSLVLVALPFVLTYVL